MRPYTCTAWSCIISFLYIKPQLKSSPVKYFTLYYIVSLHQTTTCSSSSRRLLRCIISFLYIKPQRSDLRAKTGQVVLYRFSTSNHNPMVEESSGRPVALYRFSTSNHNATASMLRIRLVVLYRFSTSNHNSAYVRMRTRTLYYIVSLHQTTTLSVCRQ